MAEQPVQPLKVNKISTHSLQNMDSRGILSDISPLGIRRNSPSFHLHNPDTTDKHKSNNNASIAFQQKKEEFLLRQQREQSSSSQNRARGDKSDAAPSATYSESRRPSLERLQKASRVRNSNMFLKDGGTAVETLVTSKSSHSSPSRGSTDTLLPTTTWSRYGTEKASDADSLGSTQKSNAVISSGKLQLHNRHTARTSKFIPDEGIWSDDEELDPSTSIEQPSPEVLRYTKTVSFDAGPPQVNEYEMVTPDLSSVASGSRESSYDPEDHDKGARADHNIYSDHNDDSFDESLEDIQKTPVVAPGEWRGRNEDDADTTTEITSYQIEVPQGLAETDPGAPRESISTSEETIRPLPPLPGSEQKRLSAHLAGSSNGTTRAASIPQSPLAKYQPPRPASVSKAEILGMRDTPMPLGERLRLLELQDQQKHPSKTQSHKINSGENPIARPAADGDFRRDNDTNGSGSNFDGHPSKPATKIPPKISRESILRNIEAEPSLNQTMRRDSRCRHNIDLDPDTPIPSSEVVEYPVVASADPPIKLEDDDENLLHSIYSYPLESVSISVHSSNDEDMFRDSSVIHHTDPGNPSSRSPSPGEYEAQHSSLERLDAPDAGSHHDELAQEYVQSEDQKRMSLPEFCSFLNEDDFGLSIMSYMTPSPSDAKLLNSVDAGSHSEPIPITGVKTNRERHTHMMVNSEPHGVLHEEQSTLVTSGQTNHTDTYGELTIPENKATIKAPGTKLKTRPSLRPGEALALLDAGEGNSVGDHNSGSPESKENISTTTLVEPICGSNFQDEKKQLVVPFELKESEVGLKLDEEFDRLLEAKHKGYLTRQNTKLVVASNREVSGEPARTFQTTRNTELAVAPVVTKEHNDEQGVAASTLLSIPSSQTWTTEPWNGRMRRQSTRKSIFTAERRMGHEPIPPLPGHQSNAVSTLEEIEESSIAAGADEEEERGRLFVKVVGVKNLALPIPDDKCWFQLTLDNGLHCVTTAWIELGRDAPVGQEFELTVFADLDFQLTLQTKIERPTSQQSTSSADLLTNGVKAQKHSAFSRFLSSPKKRRELEKRKKAGAQVAPTQKQHQTGEGRANKIPSAWDLLHNVVGPDGSFARSYVSLKDYEHLAFGRPFSTSVPCYNEWAVEDHLSNGSIHSKLGGIQRKPPYPIGMLDLQLLFVPKPRDTRDEDMPQSMSACVKQLKLAEEEALQPTTWEGHLSQQGGDCPYWRRRFFRLDGKSLISYHETTRQRRANINLSKATKLIDDRSTLTQQSASSSKDARRRRKSAFAEEEEGYMFVEEGFRIRFSNGEIIDFYADNANDKNNWMKVLSEVIRKDPVNEKITWTKLVLAQERSEVRVNRQETTAKKRAVETKHALVTEKTRPRSMVSSATDVILGSESTFASTGIAGHRKAVKSTMF